MTSSVAKSKQIIGAHFQTFFLKHAYVLMFLNIHMLFIILKTYDQQFTLTTKKSLHIIFKLSFVWFVCWQVKEQLSSILHSISNTAFHWFLNSILGLLLLYYVCVCNDNYICNLLFAQWTNQLSTKKILVFIINVNLVVHFICYVTLSSCIQPINLLLCYCSLAITYRCILWIVGL